MRRCFLAVPVSPDVQSMAFARMDGMRQDSGAVKWVGPEQMHFTLKFFGDVDDRGLFDITRVMNQVGKEFEAFGVEVFGLGAFPDTTRPRTIWAGIREGVEELQRLQQALELKLEGIGFTRDARRFQPHLTLGRVRGEADFGPLPEQLKNASNAPLGSMEIDELVLFCSEFQRHGPEYTRLATVFLK